MTITLQFASLYDRQIFVWSSCLLDLGTDFLVGNMIFVRDVLYLVVAPQEDGVTRECISGILELREMLLLFQTGVNLVSAAVVCAILESISGLEPSSVITEPRYLKLVTVSIFCPFTLIFVLMPLVLLVLRYILANFRQLHIM